MTPANDNLDEAKPSLWGTIWEMEAADLIKLLGFSFFVLGMLLALMVAIGNLVSAASS